jgi:hypothetical protein
MYWHRLVTRQAFRREVSLRYSSRGRRSKIRARENRACVITLPPNWGSLQRHHARQLNLSQVAIAAPAVSSAYRGK